MNRTEGRQLAYDTLSGLRFAKGFMSEPESFGNYDPVFVLHSKSLTIARDTRSDVVRATEFWVTLYLRRAKDASDTEKDAIEAAMDDLTQSAMEALWDAFSE